MNIQDVMDEIGQKLATIPKLRVYPYSVDKIPPPGAIVGLPESIEFDATYGRGSDTVTFPVWVMVARANAQAAGAQLAAYLDGTGARSVKAAVDSTNANTYSSCDTVTVTTAVPGAITSGGVELLGAEFAITVTGSGS